MQRSASIARRIYRWIALAAIPGTLWSALEMYGLTLGDPQMLFFSIIHTMPLMVAVVLVGFAALALWSAQSGVALLLAGYREKLEIPAKALAVFLGFGALHFALLFSYDVWSSSSARVPLCLLGATAAGLLVAFSYWHLRKPGGVQVGT